MNLSPAWVEFLSSATIEAIHWPSVGAASAPDSAILNFASEHGYIVFTHDLDFGMLLAASKAAAPSIFQVRTKDVLPSAIGSIVLSSIRTAETYFEAGAIVTLDEARARIRILPLR